MLKGNKESKRRRVWRASLLLLLLFLIFLALFLYRVKDDMVDFEVNYKAGQRLRLGEMLYQAKDGHYMFKYLPFSAFLYLPLSFLPLDAAKLIWYFIVVFCLFSLFFISKKILNQQIPVYAVAIPPLVLAKFILREIQLGQINAFVTMILLLMIWEMTSGIDKKEKIQTGLFCGLATSLKPYALVFFPYLLIKKKWKSLLTALGFLFVALLAPSFFYGFRGNLMVLKEWLSSLSRTTPVLLTSQDNISIIAFLTKWTGNKNLAILLSGIVIGFLAFFVLYLIFKGKKIARAGILESSILLILIPLISPLGWDYTLLISVLGVMILVHNFLLFPKFWRAILAVNFIIIAFSLYDIMGRKPYSEFMSWSVITVNFLILVGYLSYLRLKKVC